MPRQKKGEATKVLHGWKVDIFDPTLVANGNGKSYTYVV